MKLKLPTLLSILLSIGSPCFSQSNQVKQVVKELANFYQVHHDAVGFGAYTTEQYLRFRKLDSLATMDELKNMFY